MEIDGELSKKNGTCKNDTHVRDCWAYSAFLPRLCLFTYCQSLFVISEGEIFCPSLPPSTVARCSSSSIPYPPKEPLLFVVRLTSLAQAPERRRGGRRTSSQIRFVTGQQHPLVTAGATYDQGSSAESKKYWIISGKLRIPSDGPGSSSTFYASGSNPYNRRVSPVSV